MAPNLKPNPFGPRFLAWLERQEDAVLLETARPDASNRVSLLFLDPVRTITAHTLEEVEPALEEIAAAVEGGVHAAGWIAYEAGCAFEDVLRPLGREVGAPLLWMGLYQEPIVYDHVAGRFEGAVKLECGTPTLGQTALAPVPSLTEAEYEAGWREIRERIADGDTYQVNLTFKLRFAHPGSAGELYARLRRAQPVPYGAFLRGGGSTLLSFSPELFFRIDRRRIVLKPMKGTAPRGRTPAEDRDNRAWLEASAKDHAENLMIVDMLRNDVGRLAKTGSVRVRRFFDIERHPTVFQATSTIEALLRPGVRIPEIVRALFPSGSVTGAPKIRTMQIIRGLEPEPRGVYTGAIGYFAPGGRAVFNVAIRTLTCDVSGTWEMGVGSGVVADSDAASEYEECLLKGRFLEEPPEDFELFETLRWDRRTGWRDLQAHWRRLRASAKHFGFPYSHDAVAHALMRCAPQVTGASCRARVVLHRRGEARVVVEVLEELPTPVRVRIAVVRTRSDDPFLAHKTTRRDLYDEQLRQARAEGLFDVLFMNERGEVTEGARSNLLVRNGDRYRTPPVACGLLPGTWRARLLASKSLDVREDVLFLEDLVEADAVYVCNALRGLLPVVLVGAP